jgi:ketosteroid isomerase-like protein
MDAKSVVEHHLEALQAADLDATLADYAEDAIVITNGTVFEGHDGLRSLFGPALEAMFAPAESSFTLDSLTAKDGYAMIEWHMEFPGGTVTFGTDTFVVRDGKIVFQTGAAQMG